MWYNPLDISKRVSKGDNPELYESNLKEITTMAITLMQLKALYECSAKKDIRPQLNGVYVRNDINYLTFKATNGHCAMCFKDKRPLVTLSGEYLKDNPNSFKELFLPSDILKVFFSVVKCTKANVEDSVNIHIFDNGEIILKCGDKSLNVGMIKNEPINYPNFSRIVNRFNEGAHLYATHQFGLFKADVMEVFEKYVPAFNKCGKFDIFASKDGNLLAQTTDITEVNSYFIAMQYSYRVGV